MVKNPTLVALVLIAACAPEGGGRDEESGASLGGSSLGGGLWGAGSSAPASVTP